MLLPEYLLLWNPLYQATIFKLRIPQTLQTGTHYIQVFCHHVTWVVFHPVHNTNLISIWNLMSMAFTVHVFASILISWVITRIALNIHLTTLLDVSSLLLQNVPEFPSSPHSTVSSTSLGIVNSHNPNYQCQFFCSSRLLFVTLTKMPERSFLGQEQDLIHIPIWGSIIRWPPPHSLAIVEAGYDGCGGGDHMVIQEAEKVRA